MKLSRTGLVLLGTLLAAPLAVAPASAAPAPSAVQPLGNPGIGLSTTAFHGLDLFYSGARNTLVHQQGGSVENLGGELTVGPSAITIGSEFASTWAFVTGTDNAVWYRQFSDGRGTWGPWTSAGGRTFNRLGVTCTGDITAQPVLFAQGADLQLWRKTLPNGNWVSVGGQIFSGAGTVPAEGGVCPPEPDVFVVGGTSAVYEFRGNRFARIGGGTFRDPTALRQPDGSTDLFITGFDDALWTAHRPAGATAWSGFTRIGGRFVDSPVAQLIAAQGATPAQRIVVSVGGDGLLWQATSPAGSATWTLRRVP